MKTIGSYLCALLLACFYAAEASALLYPISFSNTLLIDTSQNQALESEPQAEALLLRPAFSHSYKIASVNFITGGREIKFDTPNFTDNTPVQCQNIGYSLTSCPSGQNKVNFCPYNNTYFQRCCDTRYKYSKGECAYPNTVSGDSCGGKFMCYCDHSLYPYTSCPAPKELNNDRCVEEGTSYYSGCVCPASYSQTCNGLNQEGVGTACSENGTAKYTSCQCKAGYNQTCSDLGPVNANDYCQMNGMKFYNNCKTCENKCRLDVCPSGVSCTLEDCSGKYCASGCAVGNIDLDDYWCGGAMKCWFR